MNHFLLGYLISVVLAALVYGYRMAMNGGPVLASHFGDIWIDDASFRRAALLAGVALWIAMSVAWPAATVFALCYLSLGRRTDEREERERRVYRERLEKIGDPNGGFCGACAGIPDTKHAGCPLAK